METTNRNFYVIRRPDAWMFWGGCSWVNSLQFAKRYSSREQEVLGTQFARDNAGRWYGPIDPREVTGEW